MGDYIWGRAGKLVSSWLAANKLSLNIDKTNLIIFHPPQKISNYTLSLKINGKFMKKEKYIKYLGIYILIATLAGNIKYFT